MVVSVEQLHSEVGLPNSRASGSLCVIHNQTQSLFFQTRIICMNDARNKVLVLSYCVVPLSISMQLQ